MAKCIPNCGIRYFIRKECNEEGRYIFYNKWSALVFKCLNVDGQLRFSWRHDYESPSKYGETTEDWWRADSFAWWLGFHYGEVLDNGTLYKVDDNPMASLHSNMEGTQRRVEIAREILGDEKWNALSNEDKAGALAYIFYHGDDAREEGRYVGVSQLEEFLDNREFYAWYDLERLAEVGKEELEMTGDLDYVFADKDNRLNECFVFDYVKYGCILEEDITWEYVELYNDDGTEAFRGIVWWYKRKDE